MAPASAERSTGGMCSAQSDRLWTLRELDILQELPTPVVVLLHATNRSASHKRYCCTTLGTLYLAEASSLQRTEPFVSCREPAQHSCQMLFGNVSFFQRFGPPRSQKEFSDIWASMSDDEQASRISIVAGTLQVANVHP